MLRFLIYYSALSVLLQMIISYRKKQYINEYIRNNNDDFAIAMYYIIKNWPAIYVFSEIVTIFITSHFYLFHNLIHINSKIFNPSISMETKKEIIEQYQSIKKYYDRG